MRFDFSINDIDFDPELFAGVSKIGFLSSRQRDLFVVHRTLRFNRIYSKTLFNFNEHSLDGISFLRIATSFVII